MNESFAFSEVVRKLANIIRIGKISEVNGAQVKVRIGRATTGWLPIISTAGETFAWTPISKDEQVAVFCPYGEFTQAFVLRSIHYDNFKTPSDMDSVSLNTKNNIKVITDKNAEITAENSIKIACGSNSYIEISDEKVVISAGDSKFTLSDSGVQISHGSSEIKLSDSSISLGSDSISTNPPVCKCAGGL